jgi:hypothetical protein
MERKARTGSTVGSGRRRVKVVESRKVERAHWRNVMHVDVVANDFAQFEQRKVAAVYDVDGTLVAKDFLPTHEALPCTMHGT